MAELVLNNLKFGQRADGGLRDDALLGLRRLVNYDLKYGGPTVDLQVRPGYSRWNSVEFSQPAEQLNIFSDMQANTSRLVIIDDLWYKARPITPADLVSSFVATPPKPYAQYGNRAFLGTDGDDDDDPGMLWVTTSSLSNPSDRSFRLGIKKPAESPVLEPADKEGHWVTATNSVRMNPTDQKRLAFEFTPLTDISINNATVYVSRATSSQVKPGSWKMSVYTDNGGEPSTTLVDTSAVSGWLPVSGFAFGSLQSKIFTLKTTVELTGGTKYWFVFDGDDTYYTSYQDVSLPTDFYGHIGTEGLAPTHAYGPSQHYDIGTADWYDFAREIVFYIGNMESDGTIAYEYMYTYYNETYGSESRPSDSARIVPGLNQRVFFSGYTTPTDPQVEEIRIYRRQLTNIDEEDEDVTDSYKHVVDFNIGIAVYDSKSTEQLGGELQTEDHFCLDDVQEDDTEDHIRTYTIVPTCAAMWKGRLWVGVEGLNQLNYSKVFEQDGPTGMIGLESPDYFPLDNTITMPEPGYPVNIYPVSNAMLAVHLSNDTTYFIYGGDQSLNPPADFTLAPFLHSNASFGIWCGTFWSHNHVYLSRAGLYMTSGVSVTLPQYLSEENQSIYDAISNTNLNQSILAVVGNEIWSLIDFDDDGVLDTILILDMQRDVPTRQLSDRSFKMYQYDVTLNDIKVVSAGDEFQTVYALDAENGFLLELRDGTLDHETSISSWGESHDLTAPTQAMIYQIDLDGWYPDESAIPTYTWLLTDHAGNTQSGTMTPTSNEDVRGHRSGTRLKGAVSVRAKFTQVSTKADRLRAIVLSYTGD